ncbi:MAG: hypothetical protein AB7E37_03115 [Candidatus Altimarinota bacterium]
MSKIITKICSVVGLSIFFASQTFACSCIPSESPEISLEKATGVFVGTVGNIEKSGMIDNLIGDFPQKKVYFTVSNEIKETYGHNTSITTSNDGASCGYEFEIGKEYLVYTYGEKENQQVSLCSRTAELAYAQEDIEAFSGLSLTENTQNIASGNNAQETHIITSAKPMNIPIIIILIIITGLFIYFRRHGK